MKPVRSAAHLAFVRSLVCCVCGRDRGIEAAHIGTGRGMGQKCSDIDTLPICYLHHREQHRIGLKRFIATYELDIPALLELLTTRPRITAWDGRYIGHWRDEVIVLGYVEQGLARSFFLLKDRIRELVRERIRERVKAFQAR